MKRFRPRIGGAQALVVMLFIVACALGMAMQRAGQVETLAPRALSDDASTMGGKGFCLVLSRLGYDVKRADSKLQTMPRDARVWVLLDPQTRFTQRENMLLLRWVRDGGTLIWACTPASDKSVLEARGGTIASTRLAKNLGVTPSESFLPDYSPLPVLVPLDANAPSPLWTGVSKASASGDTFKISRAATELASNSMGVQIAHLELGRGQVFIFPDALMFTNYAQSKPQNAVLAANLVRVYATKGAVYFDERNHNDAFSAAATRILTWWDYLWQAPLRYAMLQLLFAGVLWWAFASRRLGAPVPLPSQQPVTRASQFALGMGSLFRKANRPQAAARVLGDNFRREVARRTGLPLDAEDQILAERASQKTGLPAAMIDRLLLRAKAPDDRESRILSDTQEMEIVLRALRGESIRK